jgi:hypothetical protein
MTRVCRPDEQHALEDALAMLSVVAREAAILEAHAAHARNITDSRPIIVDCAVRIRRAAAVSRAALGRVWDGMEAEYHEKRT